MKFIVVDGCFGTITELEDTKLEHLTFEEKKEVLDRILLAYKEPLDEIIESFIRGYGKIIYDIECDTCGDQNTKYELNL